MFFFFYDDDAPEDAPKVYKVNELSDCKKALENLKELEDRFTQMGMSKEEEDEESESLVEAIQEQQKQLHDFSSKYDYDNSHLRDNLNTLLKKHGMQVNTLEAVLELSAGYVSRTLGKDAKKKLSIDVVCKIANIFNVNLNDLLNRDLTAPTKDMKTVVDFTAKLKQDVDDESSHWKKMTERDNEYQWLFFNKDGKEVKYIPMEHNSFMGEVEDIHYLKTNIGILFLVKGMGCFGDNVCYEIYQFDEDGFNMSMGSGYESEYPLTLIAETYFESTGLLQSKFDELYKAIRTHENDFVITDNAKSLINQFMNPSSDSFMDIPDDLPFK